MPLTQEGWNALASSEKRRHRAYCWSTRKANQDQVIFLLVMQAWKKKPKKRGAIFIRDWFIAGNIPADIRSSGYLTQANVAASVAANVSAGVTGAVAAIGKTFADKQRVHGGFFAALATKMGPTTLDPTLFDAAYNSALGMDHGLNTEFNPNTDYVKWGEALAQPRTEIAREIYAEVMASRGRMMEAELSFKRHLTENGFNPKEMGIY